jgi:hypothetical protein
MMLCFSSLHNLGKSLAVFFGEAVVLARARSDTRPQGSLARCVTY